MGFFGALGKIIQGKPVFEPHNQQNQAAAEQAAQQPTVNEQPTQAGGPKVAPTVVFDRIVCQANGSRIDCDAYIRNESQSQVDLDRLNFCGTTHDMGTLLRPGEVRELRIFSGAPPRNTSYDRAELTYKDQGGDYFMATYHVEWRAVGDGTYIIDRFRLQSPIRDL